MSLPTDPFAAPSSGPIVLARADDPPRPGVRPLRRRALAAATGTVALGAAVVGVTLGAGDGQAPSSAASMLPPAAAAPDPPVVGAPIVPAAPSPPAVTTRAAPAADTTSTRSRPTTRTTADREARAAALARTARLRERTWERAVERALVARAGAVRAHGHGHGHHR